MRWHGVDRRPGMALWRARCRTAGCALRGAVVWVREDQDVVHLAGSPSSVHAATDRVVDGAVLLVHVPRRAA